MTQLYIGNLPDNCTEDFLQHRFERHGKIKEILLKGKFAFLEYDEPKAADSAIKYEKELLDTSNNLILDVELANKQVKPIKGPVTLHLLNIPSNINWEKLKKMLGNLGNMQKADLVDDGDDSQWKRGIVTYELKEDAQTAIDRFHESTFEGTRLQIICPEPGPNSPLKQDKSRSRKGSSDGRKKAEESNFPVRLVVPSNMIGAIIGKEGKTIRRITDTTGARVDIHRKENAHSLKKEITVFGNADTCNQAIAMILKIMQDERATLSKPSMPSYKSAVLELLAHNDLLIKIFGPRYAGLIELMERTITEITITQSDELGKKASQDRHVIIQGSPENCCAAQREISEMYNAAFEHDMMRIVQYQDGSPSLSQLSAINSPHPHLSTLTISSPHPTTLTINSPAHSQITPMTQVNNGMSSAHTTSPQRSPGYMDHVGRQHSPQTGPPLTPTLVTPTTTPLHVTGDQVTTPQAPQLPTAQLAQMYQNLFIQQVYLKQMNQQHRTPVGNLPPHIQKMRYTPENQLYSKLVTSPPRPQSVPHLSPNALLKLLSDMQQTKPQQQGKHVPDLTDYQREQLVLAGQLFAQDYFQQQQQQANISSPQSHTPFHHYQGKYSTPKHPVFQESPYMDMQQGYSPFNYSKPAERSPMKPPRGGYPIDYDSLNMMTMLEGLEDIIGSHDGSCDSGIQASPQASCFQSNYGGSKQPRTPHWNTEPAGPRYPAQSYLDSSGESPYASSVTTSPEDEKNFSLLNGSTGDETCDFLSNSMLRSGQSQWSNHDDNFPTSGSFTIDNSNLRRELQTEYHSDKSYYNQVHGGGGGGGGGQGPYIHPAGPQSGSYTPHQAGSYAAGVYDGSHGMSGGGNLVKWDTAIPLVIGQKIESVKQPLEQLTKTQISLSQHPNNDKIVIIKSVGTPDGIQMLQNKIQMACKQALSAM